MAHGSEPTLPRAVAVSATIAVVLAGVLGTAGVGRAVANAERPDSHVREYVPTTTIGRALVAALPSRRSIDYELGRLDLATQPIEPAIRFWLVKHGDRPLANGSLPRLGPYYQLYHRTTPGSSISATARRAIRGCGSSRASTSTTSGAPKR